MAFKWIWPSFYIYLLPFPYHWLKLLYLLVKKSGKYLLKLGVYASVK